MNEKKIFSVVVPVYNAEKTIERTLASFISNKDYIHEVILVNDGTDDFTFDIIEPFRRFYNIKVISNTCGKGAGLARKTGLLEATGDWITFVDSDDCLTPTSLMYVYKELQENDNVVLLHSQTIYYESGSFDSATISHSDLSCGGNFYDRQYLIDNQLFPHDNLAMAEDEYFNELVIKHICYYDQEKVFVHYHYPVYEVHHDTDQGLSFALRNWIDYCCKYHLLCREFITERFISDNKLKPVLLEEYMDSFIFCYLLSQGLLLDDDVSFRISEDTKPFKRALDYYKKTFGKNERNLTRYYNSISIKSLLESAYSTIGFEFGLSIEFDDFIRLLREV